MPERTRLIEIIFLMGIVLIVNGATEILVNPRGSYTWAVGTPNITLIFNSSINDRLYFPRFFEVCRLSWRDKKSGGRIFEEIVPLYEHRYRPSKIWNYLNWSSLNPNETGWYIIRWSEYQQYNRTTGFILTFDGASAYNQTSIIFRSRYDRMVLLMDITIKGCHAHTMPADLLITDAPLSYNIGEEVVVKCRRNILFLQNSTYSVQNTTIVCSNASTWNVPNYGCQSGCPNLPFLRSNPELEIYMRIGEKQYFECPHGYMLYNKYQKRFQAKVARVCTGNMTWTADRFSCQAGKEWSVG